MNINKNELIKRLGKKMKETNNLFVKVGLRKAMDIIIQWRN